jgi:hypothetical protein
MPWARVPELSSCPSRLATTISSSRHPVVAVVVAADVEATSTDPLETDLPRTVVVVEAERVEILTLTTTTSPLFEQRDPYAKAMIKYLSPPVLLCR